MLSISKVFLAFFSFSDAKSRQKNLQNVEKDRKKILKSEKIAKKITKSSIKIPKEIQPEETVSQERSEPKEI